MTACMHGGCVMDVHGDSNGLPQWLFMLYTVEDDMTVHTRQVVRLILRQLPSVRVCSHRHRTYAFVATVGLMPSRDVFYLDSTIECIRACRSVLVQPRWVLGLDLRQDQDVKLRSGISGVVHMLWRRFVPVMPFFLLMCVW